MQLREWTKIYLRQRDLLRREIESLEEIDEGYLKKKKDGSTKKIIVAESLTSAYADREPAIICCENNKKNLKTLLDEWASFAKHPGLTIIFANPDLNEKWLIKPHHHAKIAEKESLARGLRAMFESVPSV